MTALVIGTFLFFGAHTILWFARSAVLYIRDRKAFKEAKRKMAEDRETLSASSRSSGSCMCW
jgi:hypothetical protein